MSPYLLSSLPQKPLPPKLASQVIERINQTRLRALRLRAAFSLTSLLVVGGYMLTSWTQLIIDVRTSSFFEFLRLGISDPDLVIRSSQDFSLGLLESLPLEPMLISLLLGFSAIGAINVLQALRRSTKSPLLSLSH